MPWPRWHGKPGSHSRGGAIWDSPDARGSSGGRSGGCWTTATGSSTRSRPRRAGHTRTRRSRSPRQPRPSVSGRRTLRGYLADERVPGGGPLLLGRKVKVRYEPLGLVGVIGPWNYPLVNTFCDAVPALMAGNAVLLKPSEVTPLTSLLVAEMMTACGLPESVLQVVVGHGEPVVDAVDFVMFTGSVATGRKVMQRAAASLTPVSLELGGKDPMIVLADANAERAAYGAAYYGLLNAGQVCI